MFQPLSEQYAEDLLEAVLQFRSRGESYERPDDVNALLELFPLVSVRQGYILDYIQSETSSGMTLPIRPFARPDSEDGWAPIFDTSEEPGREELVEQLYSYLEFQPTPNGLFEYAFFVIELWSLRASRHAAEWLESMPIFSAPRFDEILNLATKVDDVKRPDQFCAEARCDGEGGRVRFLVHTPAGWERIYYLESRVHADGFVDQEAGEIVADLGTGQLF